LQDQPNSQWLSTTLHRCLKHYFTDTGCAKFTRAHRNLVTFLNSWHGTYMYSDVITGSLSVMLDEIQGFISSSLFERVFSMHCCTALHIEAGVEQPFDCLIIQNRQAVQSMGRSVDWTLEDNMVDDLFFCTILTSRRSGMPYLCK